MLAHASHGHYENIYISPLKRGMAFSVPVDRGQVGKEVGWMAVMPI